MLALTGKLRQFGITEYEGKKKTKLWLEHTSPRENGVDDLKLEELFIDGDVIPSLPSQGADITVQVRPYVSGKGIKFSAVAVLGQKPPVASKPTVS